MGDESSTAQVHPQKLSQALMDAAQQKGAQLRIGEVQNITTSCKKVTGAHSPPEESFTKCQLATGCQWQACLWQPCVVQCTAALLSLLPWCNAAYNAANGVSPEPAVQMPAHGPPSAQSAVLHTFCQGYCTVEMQCRSGGGWGGGGGGCSGDCHGALVRSSRQVAACARYHWPEVCQHCAQA